MKTFLFIGNIGATEIIVIGIIVLLLFGGKKIPELMKGLGKGINSFKEGVKGIEDEISSSLDDKVAPKTTLQNTVKEEEPIKGNNENEA